MATPYAVPVVVREAPSLLVLRAIALAGLLTAACSLALALSNDGVSGVQVALLEWISIPYIFAGLIAWWRRPDSRLGVLMIAGGFATAVSALAFARYAFPHTVGVIFDVLPAVIFLHVYLAFPSGRLRSDFERGLVAARVRRGGRPAARQDGAGRRRPAEPPGALDAGEPQRRGSSRSSCSRSRRSAWSGSASSRLGGDRPAGRSVARWRC